MPVIFICSAIVSGIALCIVSYAVFMEIRKWAAKRGKNFLLPDALAHGDAAVKHGYLHSVQEHEVTMSSKYLLIFMILALTLEVLDMIFAAILRSSRGMLCGLCCMNTILSKFSYCSMVLVI